MSAAHRVMALLLGVSVVGTASAGSLLDAPVDNCATFLGSLSKELHFARAVAAGGRVSFRCPREREARAAVGADRARLLRVLGTPDAGGGAGTDAGDASWTYVFAPALRDLGMGGGGYPEVTFHFDEGQKVRAVTCAYGR